jgi:extradiol dioxygenase
MIRNLAYIGLRSPNAEQWRTFGPEVLGAQLAADGPDGAVRLRVDETAWRIAVHPAETDDLAYLGWEVDDVAATIAVVEAAGITVTDNGFVDPFGFRHELVPSLEHAGPFSPGRPMSGFVTGEQGLGHAVLIVPDLAAAERFYVEVLGLKASDTI